MEDEIAQDSDSPAVLDAIPMFSKAAVGVSRIDCNGRFLEVNEAFCRITGFSAEELCSRDFQSITHRDDLSKSLDLLCRLRAGEAEALVMQKRYVHKSGRHVWVRNSVTLLRGRNGAPPDFVALTEDIDEHMRAADQTRLQSAALEAAANAVIITDTAGNILWANPAVSRLTGYSLHELAGQNTRILRSGQNPKALYDEMWKTIRAGQVWHGELTNRRKDGSHYVQQMTITPVCDAAGKPTHFIAIQQDISQQRLLEEMYSHAQKMEAVGMLAGGVAHDFNNLLVVIVGYGELLMASKSLSEKEKSKIAEIVSAGKRGSALTRQLLAFSRKQVLDFKVVNLNHVLTEAAALLQRLIGEEVRLRLVLDPDLGAVMADAGQLELLLMNLAVNARDAMPHGGVLSIETSMVQVDEAAENRCPGLKRGSYVMLAVRDTGSGMDAATQARIFEPFFTTKEAGRGTGLGLATVYSIVKQSDGWIGVESAPGAGTLFRVYLPRVLETAAPPAAAEERRSHQKGSETILLLEDEDAARSVAHDMLEHAGYTVLDASTGAQAIEIARSYPGTIHILMTDVVMPEMGGLAVAESLLAQRPGLKVIYASGYPDDALLRQGKLPAGRAFLQKPYTMDSLIQKIREALGTAPH